jgi:hypothetical protein
MPLFFKIIDHLTQITKRFHIHFLFLARRCRIYLLHLSSFLKVTRFVTFLWLHTKKLNFLYWLFFKEFLRLYVVSWGGVHWIYSFTTKLIQLWNILINLIALKLILEPSWPIVFSLQQILWQQVMGQWLLGKLSKLKLLFHFILPISHIDFELRLTVKVFI